MRTGPDAQAELLNNHTFVVIDPGVVNEMAATFIVSKVDEAGNVTTKHVTRLFSTFSRMISSGVEAHVLARQAEMVAFELGLLSKNSGRTLSLENYKAFRRLTETVGYKLLQHNYSSQTLDLKAKLVNRVRSYWCSILNTILAFVDGMERRYCPGSEDRGAPIIIFGDPKFNPCMPGKPPAAPKFLIDYLKRFFPVLIVDEFHTSKLCPKCETEMELASTDGFRFWKCNRGCWHGHDGGGGPDTVNKDVTATLNMFKIFANMIRNGQRPVRYNPGTTPAQSN